MVDTTYTGPNAAYRGDPEYQLGRALSDYEAARCLMVDGTDEQQARADRSFPAIQARIDRYRAELGRLYR